MLAAAVEARLGRRGDSAAAAVATTETAAERVLVAVKAEKVISKTALAWALSHVVHSGDCVTLLAVFSGEKSGKRFWNLSSMLAGDCGSSHREILPDQICRISESCSQMVLQFHNQGQVKVRIKVVSCTPGNAVAAEARRNRASWVIVDKKLKQELKQCMEELRCNIVVMKGSQAKVLRLNLQGREGNETPYFSAASSPYRDKEKGYLQPTRVRHCTPVSSPEEPSSSPVGTTGEDSGSSLGTVLSPLLFYEQNPLFERVMTNRSYESVDDLIHIDDSPQALGKKPIAMSTSPVQYGANDVGHKHVFWIPQNHISDEKAISTANISSKKTKSATSKSLLDKFVEYDLEKNLANIDLHRPEQRGEDFVARSNVRNSIPLNRVSSTPPPLCSFCQNKAPTFGKPPKRFSYTELAEATDGFSDMNLLAEGGFGIVYKGLLRDGQVVALKLLKFAGSQADMDFCREVRLLSCAQHRNVVLLIGYCAEGEKRVLVYEYMCNGTLDFHLHGNKQNPLDWDSRLKIAIGAARGLRYLHEDCRVGCVVHRDMRPHNILLTHDFEPLVADFGLARWFSDCSIGAEERVIGTSGYLAPEYVDGGVISEKVDVYAFGLVLLELITGQKASELQYYREHLFPSDWVNPLNSLEPKRDSVNTYQLLDRNLSFAQVHSFTNQLQALGFASSLCLTRDPDSRPSMSKVLRILEGGGYMPLTLAMDLNSAGNRSDRLLGLRSSMKSELKRNHTRTLSH